MSIHQASFPLDSSAIIHLATMRKGYTNSFRLCAELTEDVCPQTLQAAANAIAPNFPTIVAGIRRGIFHYTVVPAAKPPKVCLEQEYLADMSTDMIERCAMRILYRGKRIAVEIFHSLTDGHGGLVFFNALIAEYLFRNGMISCQTAASIHQANTGDTELTVDDYISYAGAKTTPLNYQRGYKLPGKTSRKEKVLITTQMYDMQELIATSRYFGVSLTVFLTAVMAKAIFKMREHPANKMASDQPLQIMIPVNLRIRFPSKTLRNFSLYALPRIERFQANSPLEKLMDCIAVQFMEQLSKEHLSSMMASIVRLQKLPFSQYIPLCAKNFMLRNWISLLRRTKFLSQPLQFR